MAGIRRFKLLLGIIIPIFGFFLMSHNIFADSGGYDVATVNFYAGQQIESTVNLPWSVNPGTHRFFLNDLYFNNTVYRNQQLSYIAGRIVAEIQPNTTTDFFVCGRDARYSWENASSTYCLGSLAVRYTDGTTTTVFDIPVYLNNPISPFRFNIYFDFNKELESTKTIDFIQFHFYSASGYDIVSRTTNWNNTNLFVLVEGRSSISVYETPPSGVDISNDLLQTQIGQNDMMIDQNKQINTNIVEGFDQLHQDQQNASNNISGQTTSDIQGSENQQTTNLIGILTTFITYLTGRGTSSSCIINLPFPEFLGGNTSVNVCLGKNYYTMNGINYVTVFSHLFVICFFVPLIWILLKLIYNEIRSWTNG